MSELIEKLKSYVFENRNKLKECPCCKSNIEDRKVMIYKELVDALYKVYCWCGKNKRHEFQMSDIREFLGRNEYARFGDLVRFGGLLYKPKDKEEGHSRKALYGLNMARAKEFFAGRRDIPVMIVLNQINDEIVEEKRCRIGDFPLLAGFIRKNGLYDYENEPQPALF